jgi:hypothetical protein
MMPRARELIRGRVLLGILLAAGVVAAFMAVAQLWWAPFSGVMFGKALATVTILAVIAGFVAAVDIELTLGKARLMLLALIGLAAAGGTLAIAQMWWDVMAWDNFVKVMLTLLVLMGLDAFIMAVAEDFGTTRKLKDDKFID